MSGCQAKFASATFYVMGGSLLFDECDSYVGVLQILRSKERAQGAEREKSRGVCSSIYIQHCASEQSSMVCGRIPWLRCMHATFSCQEWLIMFAQKGGLLCLESTPRPDLSRPRAKLPPDQLFPSEQNLKAWVTEG